MQNKPAVGAALAVVLIVLAVWRPWAGGGDPGLTLTGKWYYDLQTQQLVAMGADVGRAPVTLPSGATAVEAHVFACGNCGGETFIGYLERWSDEAKAYFENPDGRTLDTATMQLVAPPPAEGDQPQWVLATGPEAAAVTDLASRCAGGAIVECHP